MSSDSTIPLKRCNQCGETKPLEEFYSNKDAKDGRRSPCKACEAESDRRYRAENSEERAEYQRLYRAANPEKVAEYQRRYRAENPEKIAEGKHRWCAANPDALRANGQRRRARKQGLPDTFTAQDWQRCLDYFNGCCAACGRQLKDLFSTHTAAADHWIPLNSPDCPGTIPTNMVCLCHGKGGCNTSKQDTPAAEWLTEKYGTKKAVQILARIQAYFDSLD